MINEANYFSFFNENIRRGGADSKKVLSAVAISFKGTVK